MGRYRKRPVTVEAWQWTGDEANQENLGWISEAISDGKLDFYLDDEPYGEVETDHGTARFELRDWIVKGSNGELWPVQEDTFAETYERLVG